MPRFRKKPVVIEAEQFWPTKKPWPKGVEEYPGGYRYRPRGGTYYIETLEGSMQVKPGDWIVTGIKGERYPVAPDIFEATYEPEEETDE